MIALVPERFRGGPKRELEEKGLAALEAALVTAGIGLAGRLAALTAPMKQEQGARAVARDVTSLFGGKVRVAGILKKEDPRRAAAWLQAVDKGASTRRIRRILKGTSLEGVPVLDRPDPEMHKKFMRRSRRKRAALKEPKAIVARRGAVKSFLEGNVRQVGTARKGWNDAREALGGSGSAAWAARTGKKLGSAQVRREGRRVVVEITNRVRYSRFLMSRGLRRKLVEEASVKARAVLKESRERG